MQPTSGVSQIMLPLGRAGAPEGGGCLLRWRGDEGLGGTEEKLPRLCRVTEAPGGEAADVRRQADLMFRRSLAQVLPADAHRLGVVVVGKQVAGDFAAQQGGVGGGKVPAAIDQAQCGEFVAARHPGGDGAFQRGLLWQRWRILRDWRRRRRWKLCGRRRGGGGQRRERSTPGQAAAEQGADRRRIGLVGEAAPASRSARRRSHDGSGRGSAGPEAGRATDRFAASPMARSAAAMSPWACKIEGPPHQTDVAGVERLRQRHAGIAVRRRKPRHRHGGFVGAGCLRSCCRRERTGENNDPSEERSGAGQARVCGFHPSHGQGRYRWIIETATHVGETRSL